MCEHVDHSLSSSSSCCAISTDIPDALLPPFSIVHRFWQVLKVISGIGTELFYVGFCWLSCLCSSMWRGPQGYFTYELVRTSPAMSHMSGLFTLIVFVMGGKWPYNCCFVECYLQDFFNIAHSSYAVRPFIFIWKCRQLTDLWGSNYPISKIIQIR